VNNRVSPKDIGDTGAGPERNEQQAQRVVRIQASVWWDFSPPDHIQGAVGNFLDAGADWSGRVSSPRHICRNRGTRDWSVTTGCCKRYVRRTKLAAVRSNQRDSGTKRIGNAGNCSKG